MFTKSTYLIILLGLLFIWQLEPIFAQDYFSTNTQLLTKIAGDFQDVIVDSSIIYTIEGNFLKSFLYTNENSLIPVYVKSVFQENAYPVKLFKNGNRLIVLFRDRYNASYSQSGIKIYEVTSNNSIHFLSNYSVDSINHRYDLKVTDKNIFIVTSKGELHIIDYQVPSIPKLISKYIFENNIVNGISSINLDGNIAVLARGRSGSDIIEISNIENPQKIASVEGDEINTNAIIHENYLYMFLGDIGIAKIYDISDLQNIIFLSKFRTELYLDDISVNGKYLFLSGSSTKIVDVSDKYFPRYVANTAQIELVGSHFISNDKIFSTTSGYLKVYSFNISNSSIKIMYIDVASNYFSGQEMEITTLSYNIHKINLEISSDSGQTWSEIVIDHAISGDYNEITFSLPRIHSKNCLIKITNSDSLDVYDIFSKSFTVYTLQLLPFVNKSYINSVNIRWRENDIDTVSLYYSIDDANSWINIVENYSDNYIGTEKTYNWEFENVHSDSVLIKVMNSNDTTIFNISKKIELKNSSMIIDTSNTNLLNYFPLQAENYWQYKKTHISGVSGETNQGYDKIQVFGETVINNIKYYNIRWLGNNKYFRVDTLHNSILSYINGEEKLLFELDSQNGDCWQFENTNRDICNEGIYEESIFCNIDTVMHLNQYFYCKAFILSSRIGPVWISNDDSYQTIDYDRYDLVYAKINGVEYGTFVSVENEDSSHPIDYFLSQNYPNPFNPSTRINYSLPHSSKVTLKVYDILGNEIKTLVNKEQNAGIYEVEYDSKGLSSGIYFYRIVTDRFSEMKKMILLK